MLNFWHILQILGAKKISQKIRLYAQLHKGF